MRLRYTFVCTALLALLCACQPDLHFIEDSFRSSSAEATLAADRVSILFTDQNGRATLEFESNKSWTAAFVNDRAAEWCTIPSEEGKKGVYTLTIDVTRNESYDERSASIILTCEDLTRTIVVTQKQKDALLLSPERVEIPQEGGSFTVQVQANIDFTATPDGGCDWIHPVGTKGLVTTLKTFSVDANTTVEPRQAYVAVESTLGKRSVTVYQPGETPTLVVSQHQAEFPATGGTLDVQVTSNLDVEVLLPADCTWLEEIQTKTISTNTYFFNVAVNAERSDRQAQIVFRNQSRKLSDTVFVRQLCDRILLSDSLVNVPSHSVDFALEVFGTEPDSYSVDCPVKWVELTEITPDEASLWLHFRVQDNPDGKARSVKFGVFRSGAGTHDVVTLNQLGHQPIFSFVKRGDTVSAPALNPEARSAWVYWGDGCFEPWQADLVHHYEAAGPHTVQVEGTNVYRVLVAGPENGMHFDFKEIH